MKRLSIVILASPGIHSYAQEVSKIKVSGWLETSYGYDFNTPGDNNRPPFVYLHNRHNEVNLNFGFIKGTYDKGEDAARIRRFYNNF